MNINETITDLVDETEPAEYAENTEKLGNTIMVSEMSIFTLAVENLQFNWDQCNRTNSSEKGWTHHMWMKQNPCEDFRRYHFIIVLGFIKKKLMSKKKCKEGNSKCNMENVPEGHYSY